MRVGQNPNKNHEVTTDGFNHHVVIPVYIPNLNGYFRDSFKILQLCLGSLIKTANKNTFITVVNNGSCQTVTDFLQLKFTNNELHEIVHTSNIGKLNSVVKGVLGHQFDYVTISDADVLFLNNWQRSTYEVFLNLPMTGVVGLVPQFKLYSDMCYNVLFDFFLSKKLSFTAVKNPKAMQHFYKSIGWDDTYNKDFLKYHLTLKGNNNLLAVVGSGHFVATYHKDVVKRFNTSYSTFKMGKSLRTYFDKASLKAGRYRLTTEDNYAYHMGNIYEPYMDEVFESLVVNNDIAPNFKFKDIKTSYISYFLKNHLFRKLLEYNPFINWFIRFKGLNVDIAKTPWHK